MATSIGIVKKLAVLACIFTLPLGLFGYFLFWAFGTTSLFLCFLWVFMPLIILGLLIIGGVCGRPKLTLALCGTGLATFLFYATAIVLLLYALRAGILTPPLLFD